jgi:hypothetical protein
MDFKDIVAVAGGLIGVAAGLYVGASAYFTDKIRTGDTISFVNALRFGSVGEI